jgi:hypothetical protein
MNRIYFNKGMRCSKDLEGWDFDMLVSLLLSLNRQD